jgi:hypothetical protein
VEDQRESEFFMQTPAVLLKFALLKLQLLQTFLQLEETGLDIRGNMFPRAL